jgi:hypothetical protein
LEQSPSWEANSHSASQQIPLLSLPSSQELATGLYPQTDASSPHLLTPPPRFPKIHYDIIFTIIGSVGIALGYGLDDWGSRVRFPVEAGNFYLHHRVENGSGAHPASYPMGTGGSFPGVKRPGREADHSPPFSAEVEEWVELYLHSPNTPSWRGAQLKAQGQLYLFCIGHLAPLMLKHFITSSYDTFVLKSLHKRLCYRDFVLTFYGTATSAAFFWFPGTFDSIGTWISDGGGGGGVPDWRQSYLCSAGSLSPARTLNSSGRVLPCYG